MVFTTSIKYSIYEPHTQSLYIQYLLMISSLIPRFWHHPRENDPEDLKKNERKREIDMANLLRSPVVVAAMEKVIKSQHIQIRRVISIHFGSRI